MVSRIRILGIKSFSYKFEQLELLIDRLSSTTLSCKLSLVAIILLL